MNKWYVTIGVVIVVLAVIAVVLVSVTNNLELNDGSEVYFAMREGDPSLTFDSNEAKEFEKDFGARLATFNEVNAATAAGARWPLGGWTAEGRAVKPSRPLMHLQEFPPMRWRRTSTGLVTDVQAVGYLLYGKKPAQNAIPSGYLVAPFKCSGEWSAHTL